MHFYKLVRSFTSDKPSPEDADIVLETCVDH